MSEPTVAGGPADILNGYSEIAAFLRMTPRQVKARALAKEIPVFKLGHRTVRARKSTLIAWLAKCEADAAQGPSNDLPASS